MADSGQSMEARTLAGTFGLQRLALILFFFDFRLPLWTLVNWRFILGKHLFHVFLGECWIPLTLLNCLAALFSLYLIWNGEDLGFLCDLSFLASMFGFRLIDLLLGWVVLDFDWIVIALKNLVDFCWNLELPFGLPCSLSLFGWLTFLSPLVALPENRLIK